MSQQIDGGAKYLHWHILNTVEPPIGRMSDGFSPPGAGQVQIGPVGRGGSPLHAESD